MKNTKNFYEESSEIPKAVRSTMKSDRMTGPQLDACIQTYSAQDVHHAADKAANAVWPIVKGNFAHWLSAALSDFIVIWTMFMVFLGMAGLTNHALAIQIYSHIHESSITPSMNKSIK